MRQLRKYKCSVCGYIHEAAGDLPEDFTCPLCTAPGALFTLVEEAAPPPDAPEEKPGVSIRYMDEIHQMAASGQTIIEAMGIQKPLPSWDDILILGAQLDPMPLEHDAPVDTSAVIGPRALKPLVLDHPVYISHMSFGALSREAKIALAKGGALAKAAMCSGEGGILPEEMAAAYKYIFEYVPNLYSVTPEHLRGADAIEIKIGQGTKPGLGGHLPGEKVTEEIAAVRGKPVGRDIHSPSRFSGVDTPDDLKALVDRLRAESGGRPIGIKIAAGHIERDLAFCVYAGADFVTIDGRGGATAASPRLVRDAASVPTIYALYRARKYLDAVNSDISLVITGGLRVSSDFAKAIAMGAQAVAVATPALLALGCKQYRICGSGKCPMGIATQDPVLRARLDVDAAARGVANFLGASFDELKAFARLTGHSRLRDLSAGDLCTANREISEFTNIAHT
ncbi:MAG: glutamate synthase-related protein [Firmicutes bacterium]|nr:glutamate synthase-related protein [Bacillota bacterium]